MTQILDFLQHLAANNDRTWFASHKADYDTVKAQTQRLAQEFIALVSEVNPQAAMLSVADCTYRIYRDTRFSLDKTPYKTHIGIFVNPPHGKKSITMGHYLHIEPGKSFYCAGNIGLPSPLMTAIRQSIYTEIDEFRSIVEDPDFRRLLPILGEDLMKTAPRGFSRQWPFIDYVRTRHFLASSEPFTAEFLRADSLIDRLRPYICQGERFNRFINFTIEEQTRK